MRTAGEDGGCSGFCVSGGVHYADFIHLWDWSCLFSAGWLTTLAVRVLPVVRQGRTCQVLCVCGFCWIWLAGAGLDYVTECKRHGLSVSHTCEVPLDERGSSVGYSNSYVPRHDVLNTASLGTHLSLIIACFSVPKHDTFNAASLGAVCCHTTDLKKSNTSHSCMCYTRTTKGYGVHSISANLF